MITFMPFYDSYVHLVDSSKQKKKGQEGYDPLFKICPVVDHLNAVSKRLYNPCQELSVDEMMIGTRCHISFLQYMPTNFGLKVWVNAEATTGYALSFSVYTELLTLQVVVFPLLIALCWNYWRNI